MTIPLLKLAITFGLINKPDHCSAVPSCYFLMGQQPFYSRLLLKI